MNEIVIQKLPYTPSAYNPEVVAKGVYESDGERANRINRKSRRYKSALGGIVLILTISIIVIVMTI